MVMKVEAACKRVGVEFLGWDKIPNTDEIKLRLRRDDINATLKMSLRAFEVMSGDTLTSRIAALFDPPKEVQS